MNKLKCSFYGCEKIVESDIPFSSRALYTCAEHMRKAPDSPDRPRFQNFQFDPEIPRSKKH